MAFAGRWLLELFRILWFLAAILGALFTLVREECTYLVRCLPLLRSTRKDD